MQVILYTDAAKLDDADKLAAKEAGFLFVRVENMDAVCVIEPPIPMGQIDMLSAQAIATVHSYGGHVAQSFGVRILKRLNDAVSRHPAPTTET